MRCEDCQGTGLKRHELDDPIAVAERVDRPPAEIVALRLPCLACGGSGWAHCCEGERPDNRIKFAIEYRQLRR